MEAIVQIVTSALDTGLDSFSDAEISEDEQDAILAGAVALAAVVTRAVTTGRVNRKPKPSAPKTRKPSAAWIAHLHKLAGKTP